MANELTYTGATAASDVQEQRWLAGLNVATTALAIGTPVYLDTSSANGDGIRFTVGTTTNLGALLGAVQEAVAVGGYTEKILRYGVGEVRVIAGTTVVDPVGTPFLPSAGALNLIGSTTQSYTAAQYPAAVTGMENGATTAGAITCFINL